MQREGNPVIVSQAGSLLRATRHAFSAHHRGLSSPENREVLDFTGGADADRTRDLLNAIQALSQTELQPHRRRDFSANPMQSVESTDPA